DTCRTASYPRHRLRHPTFQRIFGPGEEEGWVDRTYAGTPPDAISRSNWSLMSQVSKAAPWTRLHEHGSRFRAELAQNNQSPFKIMSGRLQTEDKGSSADF